MLHAHTPCLFHAPTHSRGLLSLCTYTHTPLEYAHVHIPDCLSPLRVHTHVCTHLAFSHVHTPSFLSSSVCAQTPVPTNLPSFCLCAHTHANTPCAHAHSSLSSVCTYRTSLSPSSMCAYSQVHTLLWKNPKISSVKNQAITQRELRFITCSPTGASALKIWALSYVQHSLYTSILYKLIG